MRVGYSAGQVRRAESALITAGVPLMARAASALAAEIRGLLVDAPTAKVLLLVGSGDNGGDTLFAGAELSSVGLDVLILAVGSHAHEAGTAAALGAGARWITPDEAELEHLVDTVDVVVDGILGTGASSNPALRGQAREVVAIISERLAAAGPRPSVVAVDVPSGIDPTTGAVPDEIVLHADLTVTFGGIKAGLLRHPGADYAGRVVLAEIGIAAELASVHPVFDGT